MNLDANEVSRKSNGIAIMYLLTFGIFGAHRFYVGKWKTGLVCLLIGLQLPVIRILMLFGASPIKSLGYQIILFLFSIAFLAYDLFAMAQEMFSDSQGKILLGSKNRDGLIGRSPKEKAEDKMSMIISLMIFFIMMVFLLVILPVIASYA